AQHSTPLLLPPARLGRVSLACAWLTPQPPRARAPALHPLILHHFAPPCFLPAFLERGARCHHYRTTARNTARRLEGANAPPGEARTRPSCAAVARAPLGPSPALSRTPQRIPASRASASRRGPTSSGLPGGRLTSGSSTPRACHWRSRATISAGVPTIAVA